MPSFFFALVAAAAVTAAGREAARVAWLAAGLGPSVALLVTAWIAATLACALSAWIGAGLGARLGGDGKAMLVAFALLVAGIELLVLRPLAAPAEPTASLGAIALVLGAAQLTAAAGFLVFALAAATAGPWLAAAGGAVGSGAALGAAWALGGEWHTRMPLRALRYGVAAALIVAALATGLSARGLLG